jgi:hypothetical protein
MAAGRQRFGCHFHRIPQLEICTISISLPDAMKIGRTLTISSTRHTSALCIGFEDSSISDLRTTEAFFAVFNTSESVPLVDAGGEAFGDGVGAVRRIGTVVEDTASGRVVIAALVHPSRSSDRCGCRGCGGAR